MIGNNLKFDDLVYSSICEVSYFNFKRSEFTRFAIYCENFKSSFNGFEFSNKQTMDILIISKYIKLIYSFDSDQVIDYISEFFKNSHFKKFYEIILLSDQVFKNNNDIDKWLYSIK